MLKVLITGSQGYLGSVLCDYLRSYNYSILSLDAGFFWNSIIDWGVADSSITLRDARDITDDDLIGVQAVVHLAGISNDPMGRMDASQVYDPTRAYTRRLAIMCKERGIKFIFASSCSVYGIGGEERLDENSKVNPQTGYSLNKFQIEQDLSDLSDSAFSPIALRFATVFGPSPRIRFDVVINMFAGMAVADGHIVLNSDGSAWRPNLHILDLCESVRLCLELEYSDGKLLIMNVGDEHNNCSILDLAKIVQQKVPGCKLSFLEQQPELDESGLIRDRKVKGSDTRTYRVSFAKIRTILKGFSCKWTIEDGVEDLVNWLVSGKLTSASFRNKGFYRLQQLEFLINEGYLSDELRWKKPYYQLLPST